MSKFIELTNGGCSRYVNVDNIAYVRDDNAPSGCTVYFVGDLSSPLFVDESFKKVQMLIGGNV